MFGRRPYPGVSRKEYKERIMSTIVQIKNDDKPNNWSEESREFINGLLQRKEEMRLGHQGAQSLKSHPWFKDINWDQLLEGKLNAPFVPPDVNLF